MVGPGSCVLSDDTLGPWAGNCRGGFDFTLLFEQSILSLLPLCVLLLIIPLRISYLIKRDIKVDRSLLSPSKWVCGLLNPYSCSPIPRTELKLRLCRCCMQSMELSRLLFWRFGHNHRQSEPKLPYRMLSSALSVHAPSESYHTWNTNEPSGLP